MWSCPAGSKHRSEKEETAEWHERLSDYWTIMTARTMVNLESRLETKADVTFKKSLGSEKQFTSANWWISSLQTRRGSPETENKFWLYVKGESQVLSGETSFLCDLTPSLSRLQEFSDERLKGHIKRLKNWRIHLRVLWDGCEIWNRTTMSQMAPLIPR